MTISVGGGCLKRKTMFLWVKEYINKNFATCKNYILLSKKTPKCKYWVLKVLTLRPKWCVLTNSKMTHSVFVSNVHQNGMLLVNAIDRSRRSFATLRATNASCIGVNSVLALQLWENFLIRNSTNMKMMGDLITASRTLLIEQYWQPLQPLTKNTKRRWLLLLMI